MQPAAPVQLAAVIEEECTGNGALAVMHALPMPDACLIPEPGPGFPALYVAEVGVVWAWVTVTGRPVHVREAHAGVSAIQAAAIVAEAFAAYEREANRAERRHPAFAADNHPINVNIGTFEGGEWNSSVATRARLGVRVGVMPGQSCLAVKAEIEALVARTARTSACAGPGWRWSSRASWRMAASSRRSSRSPGWFAPSTRRCRARPAPLRRRRADGRTPLRAGRATQATCYGPDAQNIHGIDESVGLDCVTQTTKVLALTIAAWCGLERRPSR